jgi:hypothetical protein
MYTSKDSGSKPWYMKTTPHCPWCTDECTCEFCLDELREFVNAYIEKQKAVSRPKSFFDELGFID